MNKTLAKIQFPTYSPLGLYGRSNVATARTLRFAAALVEGPADAFQRQAPRNKVLFVINPKAGSVTGSVRHNIETLLKEQGKLDSSQVEFFEIGKDGALEERLKTSHATLNQVIIGGGDGTITRGIGALMPYPDIKVGILPLGTGNRLAHNLGIPLDLEGALKTALEGKPYALDIGRFNNDVFTLMAGAGLDASIMEESNNSPTKKWLGIGTYIGYAFKHLFLSPKVTFEVEVDGQKLTRSGTGVVVANVGDILGKFSLTPGAKANDGVLDVAIIAVQNKMSYFKALLQILRGKVGDSKAQTGIIHLKAKEIKINSTPAVKTQVDGDVNGMTPVTIRFERQMNIMVPA